MGEMLSLVSGVAVVMGAIGTYGYYLHGRSRARGLVQGRVEELPTAECEERCCDANASIEAALRIANVRARGVASFMVEAPAPVPLAIDGGRMVQVLVNLLTNAVDSIEADPSRRGRGTVWIQLSRRRLVIADDGPGISRRARGSGADLALCRQYLSESGFSITADGRPGGGARFIVNFN